jgi:phosphate transport system substrate-binding protein
VKTAAALAILATVLGTGTLGEPEPILVAVNHSVPVTNLSQAQMCGILAGRVRSWREVGGADAPIIRLAITGDDGDTLALRKHLACPKGLREGPAVVAFANANKMAAALATRPGTIGLITLGAVQKAQGRVRAVAIGGVAPTPEAVRAGRAVGTLLERYSLPQ